MKVKSESEVAQSCLTPSDAMDWSSTRFLRLWDFQARVLEWVAIAFSASSQQTPQMVTIFILQVKKLRLGISLAVQWLRLHDSKAGGSGSIPSQGTMI